MTARLRVAWAGAKAAVTSAEVSERRGDEVERGRDERVRAVFLVER